MIKQLTNPIKYSRTEIRYLNNIKPHSGLHWDRPFSNEIKKIKKNIRNSLTEKQKCCAYCGLDLGGTSDGQIDHIAAKAF